MLKRVILFVCLFVSNICAFSQYRESLIYGLKGGVVWSQISNTDKIIMSETFFTHYDLKNKGLFGGAGGFFINARLPNEDRIAVEAELMYGKQGTHLDFINTAENFTYQMRFKYQYVNLAAILSGYCGNIDDGNFGSRFSAGIGAQVGFAVGGDKIFYTSQGGPASFGSDLEQQQQLRNVLQGRNTLNLLLKFGYEFESMPVLLDLRGGLGMTNVTEVMPNSYNFIPQTNRNVYVQFTVGGYFGRRVN